MKIVLATPLYPPDIAEPAPYVKELARRLAMTDDVTIVAYAHLPELVPGVRVVAVSKHRRLVLRLITYTYALWKQAKEADVLYVQNGPSVELPAAIVSRIVRATFIVRIGDLAAHERAKHHLLPRLLERFSFRKAKLILTDTPFPRPEIFPFEARPDKALERYERSWEEHVHVLRATLNHA